MTDKLTVLYNDTCPICSREVEGYKRITRKHDLDVAYEGWSSADLDAYGLNKDAAARRFYVATDHGLLSGVDAFAALWARLPGFGWLARVVNWPVIRPVARLAYDHVAAPALFAMHRRRQRRAGTERLASK